MSVQVKYYTFLYIHNNNYHNHVKNLYNDAHATHVHVEISQW